MGIFGRKKKKEKEDSKQNPSANTGGDTSSGADNKNRPDLIKRSKGGAPVRESPAAVLARGMLNVRDIIAPPALEVDFSTIQIGNMFYRTLFVSGYPRFVGANWLSPVINFDHSLDISMFYYPVKSKTILDDLRRKITELEATLMSTKEKGRIADPAVTTALDDAKALQDQLVKGIEKYFQFSFYITIPAESEDELNNITAKLESTLGSLLLISKTATLQMEDAFKSTLPTGQDKLLITRNMDTTSLATTFPFTSSDLTMDEGIMYGVNRHNGSLVIFDRFSMENANTVVFAKSGAGKSYFVKLEALRLMLFGAEVMIIDPEEEYRTLCDAVGGNYIDFSSSSPAKINPFDLSGIAVEGENELGQKLIALLTLLKLMLGDLTPTEEAILDRALIETYRIKGITTDPATQMEREPPVMEDLYKVIMGFSEPEARGMADRLEKFIKGSMTGIFDSQSNIDLKSKMTVFSTKNLEEALRPIAFYIILDFVWTRIRRDLRKRILIVEEAWYLMENEDSARFIYGIAKRARKYYLGLTTISQDVDDFLTSEYGKAIVTNSSIQMLFKQHPAAIDKVADTFYLSEGERRLLLAANVGEGLFFAGTNHVAIKIKASEAEHNLVTTNPKELLKLRQEGLIPSGKKPKQSPPKGSTPPSTSKPPQSGAPRSSGPPASSGTPRPPASSGAPGKPGGPNNASNNQPSFGQGASQGQNKGPSGSPPPSKKPEESSEKDTPASQRQPSSKEIMSSVERDLSRKKAEISGTSKPPVKNGDTSQGKQAKPTNGGPPKAPSQKPLSDSSGAKPNQVTPSIAQVHSVPRPAAPKTDSVRPEPKPTPVKPAPSGAVNSVSGVSESKPPQQQNPQKPSNAQSPQKGGVIDLSKDSDSGNLR
jgi:conjugal transfer ATP-binding protein TraC